MKNSLEVLWNELEKGLPDDLFCDVCNDFVKFNIDTKLIDGEYHGKPVRYIEHQCYCAECNSRIYPCSICNYNIEVKTESYKKQYNIITRQQIEEIPQKYNIGVKSLSLVLGLNANEYKRFIYGEFPSKQCSNFLLDIYNYPEKFAELLLQNADKISKNVLKRSLKAVNQLLINSSKELNQLEEKGFERKLNQN